jgi:hypothetical protein
LRILVGLLLLFLGLVALIYFRQHSMIYHPRPYDTSIASFTTLRKEAATIVGRPLSHLLIEDYDNRATLSEIANRNPDGRIAIFHGVDDDDIPVRMGRELGDEFPFIEFFPVDGADHVSVLTRAREQIIDWMNR